MAVPCPQCGFIHDVVEFESDREVICGCGFHLNIYHLQTAEDLLRFLASEEERKKAEEIRDDAQAICRMILDENADEVDIGIARDQLREKVKRLFPTKVRAYEMIYESRFNRLWEQFRNSGQGPS